MITPLIILILLSGPLAIAFVVAKAKSQPLNVTKFSCWGLGVAFIGHIVKTGPMVEMLPPWLPMRLVLVYLTGLLELAVGIALFLPKYQLAAAKVAIVIFVVFFPANIYSALQAAGPGGHQWGPIYLLIRAPLQIALIAWAYFLCVKRHNKQSISSKP